MLDATFSNRLTNFELNFNNLENYLWKFSLILDSLILFRLLLHKISWDLNLFSKKRILNAQDSHHSFTNNNYNYNNIHSNSENFSSGAKELRKERRKRYFVYFNNRYNSKICNLVLVLIRVVDQTNPKKLILLQI